MPRLFRLMIAMLPLALGTATVGAQEARPGGRGGPHMERPQVQVSSQGPREVRPRESLMQQPPRRRDPEPSYAPQPPPQAQPQAQERRSMSDAIRHVQRATGGQILSAEQVPFEGRNITRVKYMDERGRVRYMDAPGTSERRPRRADNDTP
ncbi:hypothetical protein [Pseudoxanthomonas suwonensis]|uniref:hypothetical protein n=2 Tax=Pseudoxanthomonas TaxID=83618 RepID=UPI0004BC2266